MKPTSKRDQLVKTGLELFAREGFHAVGVETLSMRAGVTKRTLYHHFKSKDELVLAVLRHYDERFRNAFMRSVESRARRPVERLLAVFDVAKEWFSRKDFHGCILVGALGEFPEPHTPIRKACRDSKTSIQNYIKGLAKDARLENPGLLAAQLVLLLEGAITMAQVSRSPRCAGQAKKAAAVLIRNAQKP